MSPPSTVQEKRNDHRHVSKAQHMLLLTSSLMSAPQQAFTSVQGWNSISSEQKWDKHVFSLNSQCHMVWYLSNLEADVSESCKSFWAVTKPILGSNFRVECHRVWQKPGVWLWPVILALGRKRQKDHKFEAILGYMASSRPAWATWKSCQKTKLRLCLTVIKMCCWET